MICGIGLVFSSQYAMEKMLETKTCNQCGIKFDITDQDIAFLDKLSPIIAGQKYSLPAPDICPDCRQQQRCAFRNRRNLYKRKCDLTGKPIVSMYSLDKPFKVYYNKDYESDFDASEYGRDFDFERPFFEQIKELQIEVPRFHSAVITETMENSEYVNGAHNTKNSYLSLSVTDGEDIYYSEGVYHSKNCLDCYHIHDCELCYACIESSKMYKSMRCNYCVNCSYCNFCLNCENCNNCFGCVNQIGKNYCIFNKQYSKEEYLEKIKEYQLSYSNIQKFKQQFHEFKMQHPHKYARLVNVENSIGDDLINAKNCFHCFGSEDVEDMRYCYFLNEAKTCGDALYFGTNLEHSYRLVTAGSNAQNIYFCYECYDNVSHLYYCDSCVANVKNCFGCIGLRNKEYCILNKQYTKEEYEQLVPQIIEKMQANGERGEFFPSSYSPFGYNETLAIQHFPLTQEEAEKKGYNWMTDEYSIDVPEGTPTIPADQVPETIKEVNDEEILDKAIICEVTGKPFRVVKQELELYRKFGLPIPHKHPNQRHKERFSQVNLKKIWERKCDKCGIDMKTTYSSERKETVYCEACYNKEVYG